MGCFSSKPEETNEATISKEGETTAVEASAAAVSTVPYENAGIDIDNTDPKLLPSAQCVQMPAAELLEATAMKSPEPVAVEEKTVVDPKVLPSAQTIAQPAQEKEAAAQQVTAATTSK
ncbi:hypothetical protein Pmar_PMAR025572 [Perkinsus marinus ATCC 50983]|uniref:Uncharacterized protein n=1 Tax=Perkinsus marinus (strain ATCC 50983 / TXsc) TaxID=423536 RepID=C5LZF1_PERM5|nr:hypothetical protein Pmar_PMAR025572 [Perkinsus marinus ATCC 50983]EEQ97945.1 hypothetical protein Pmar_PMAR025572 [Perkinsus marinus ATCC 50983]|eukprot:XP_002765228.1 hypothetical protein Pmar_PMAR025572 [Perkinsus marinus ATCC 50983]